MSQLEMFRQNIRLLIGILSLILLAGFALFIGWTLLRAWLSARREKRGLEHLEHSRRDAAGRPLPPTGMGICATCGTAGQDIFHLPGRAA